MADHVGFIAAAYGVTAVCLVGTALVLLLDYRAQRRILRDIDKRRSAP